MALPIADNSPLKEDQGDWMLNNLHKTECIKFVQDENHDTKCVCGRLWSTHPNVPDVILRTTYPVSDQWQFTSHTESSPTDAYGTIEFQGGTHPTKAQYVRLSFDTKPEKILQLLHQYWGLDLPKLIISVHGGIANFELQPKLKRVCKQGIFSAAKTTGAWIITGGLNTGVMSHVGEALGDTLVQSRNKIVTIGIAPWGMVHKRENLVGKNAVVQYHAISLPGSDNIVLNSSHSYFLLVDDGSVGKFGCEVLLRKNLEKYISKQKSHPRGCKEHGTPVVGLLMEGGSNCIRTVVDCITDHPPVPVVIIDGSGRASDLLSFTLKYAQSEGTMPDVLKQQLLTTIENTFQYNPEVCLSVYTELMVCAKNRNFINIFRISEDSQGIDEVILNAILKGQNTSSLHQLNLTMAWNRVDVARNHIFTQAHLWAEGALDQAMMDALVNDRTDFVKLLIENGVNMNKWLTIQRLEDLYNQVLYAPKPAQVKGVQYSSTRATFDLTSTLKHLLSEVKRSIPPNYRYTLYDIGQVINKVMGGAYQSSYCKRKFRLMHYVSKNKISKNFAAIEECVSLMQTGFRYPFSELMIWAVLLRRQKMAMFMWERGEESLAKCLVAANLYKTMIKEAEEDEYEIDVANELRRYHHVFYDKATELLDHCYKTDEDLSQLLLTYELNNFGNLTCLSLAVAGSNKAFVAHTCCQMILTKMWMGGLRTRKYPSLKVLFGILWFPLILLFDYKSVEELEMMPQTQEEHTHNNQDDDSSDSDSDESTAENIEQALPVLNQLTSMAITVMSDLPGGLGVPTRPEDSERSVHITIPETNVEKTSPRKPSIFKLNPAGQSNYDGRKMKQLSAVQKIFEFYTAPITKFWLHTIGYCAFLLVFIYTMIISTPIYWPNAAEWYVAAYMLGLSFEMIRKFLTSGPTKFKQKLMVFFFYFWHVIETICITMFFTAFAMRFTPELIGHARALYAITVTVCICRLVKYFVISPTLGPFVQIFGKMVKTFIQLMVFIILIMIAFGVARQSIWFPDNDFQWESVREIFLKPYMMLYGEVYQEVIWPKCAYNASDSEEIGGERFKCVPGRWLIPVFLSIYLAVGILMLISLIIAVFNNLYQKALTHSNEVWKFQRYMMVIEYESHPILPSPFIIVSHIIMISKFLIQKCKNKHKKFDQGLKVFLNDEDLEKLHDFEEECIEFYFKQNQQSLTTSNEFSSKNAADRLENAHDILDDIQQKENSLGRTMSMMQQNMSRIENMEVTSNYALWLIQKQLEQMQKALIQTGSSITQSESLKTSYSIGNQVFTDEQVEENVGAGRMVDFMKISTDTSFKFHQFNRRITDGIINLSRNQNTDFLLGQVGSYTSLSQTPFKSPVGKAEYTSITDNIDTSFLVINTSSCPPGTPPSYHQSFISSQAHASKHKQGKKKRRLKKSNSKNIKRDVDSTNESNQSRDLEDVAEEHQKKVTDLHTEHFTDTDNELFVNKNKGTEDESDNFLEEEKKGKNDTVELTKNPCNETVKENCPSTLKSVRFEQARGPHVIIEMDRLDAVKEDEETRLDNGAACRGSEILENGENFQFSSVVLKISKSEDAEC